MGLHEISFQHRYRNVHIAEFAIFSILIVAFILIVFATSAAPRHPALSTLEATKRTLQILLTSCQYIIKKTRDLFVSRTTSSVDRITDYNGFYSILLHHATRVWCKHGESHAVAREH